MPNRIIKESICTSETISALTDFEFRLWVGLITQADDAGRGDARPAIIKGRVFPLRERVTAKDIDAAIHGLADKGCVSLYNVGGKPYFCFPTWGEHQRIRDCKPKFPGADEADAMPTDDVFCDNLRQTAADCGLNPIQSNPNPNPNPSIDKKREKAHFIPPSLAEVEAYCKERGNAVDAKRFFDYFEANSWKDASGKPVKSWKQKVITWESYQTAKPKTDVTQAGRQGASEDEVDAMRRMFAAMGGKNEKA